MKAHLVAAQQCSNAKMSDADRSTIVEQHNRLRSELAFGRAKTVDGGFAPSGKNIYKMVCYIMKFLIKTFHAIIFGAFINVHFHIKKLELR